MRNSIFALALSMVALVSVTRSAFAAKELTFTCLRDDDADDWNLEINLTKNYAYLFDNDRWARFDYKGSTKKIPPTHVFKETDSSVDFIYFRPSRNLKSGTATYRRSGRDEYVVEFSCKVAPLEKRWE